LFTYINSYCTRHDCFWD